MNTNFSQNHFELFQLPVAFTLDLQALERAYREVQREVHPDRVMQGTDSERRIAAQWATHANEAYRTLKSPLNRGRYFLRLHGVDTQEESHTAMPINFLMQQMEWREAVVDARRAADGTALEKLAGIKRNDERQLFALLAQQLCDPSAYVAARETVRKLRFLEKLGEEIDLASEALDA